MGKKCFQIELPNGTPVDLSAPALDVVIDDGQYYIILDSDPPQTITDNVLYYSKTGRLLWRIEDILPNKSNKFGAGRLRRDGSLEFWNNDGVWIKVDKVTGQAIGFRIETMGPLSECDEQVFKPIFWRE